MLVLLLHVAASDATLFGRNKLVPPYEKHPSIDVAIDDPTVSHTGSAFFQQLLDHDDPSKGTFQQKFWWNSEWWEGPGSPVSELWPAYRKKY